MPILIAELQQILVLTDTNHATLRSHRVRGTAACAFGTTHPVKDWWLLDAVAMLVRDDLVRSGMPMRVAAIITRIFFDHWSLALSHFEHLKQRWLFTTAELGRDQWWTARGPAKDLPGFIDKLPREATPRRIFNVDLAEILSVIKQRAEKARFDLSGGDIVFRPDNPTFLRWQEEFQRRRASMPELFNPMRAKPPPRPSAAMVASIMQQATCSISRIGGNLRSSPGA
jgi:hypothetical protein